MSDYGPGQNRSQVKQTSSAPPHGWKKKTGEVVPISSSGKFLRHQEVLYPGERQRGAGVHWGRSAYAKQNRGLSRKTFQRATRERVGRESGKGALASAHS